MPSGAAASELQELIEGAAALGVVLSREQGLALLRLLDELAVWNRTYNLTAITDRAAMIRAHLLDSLSAVGELQGRRIADVGTGAGFPGLPLALVAPEREFVLIDSVGKKVRFVAHAARALHLPNVSARQGRVQALGELGPFDTVLARAYAPLALLLADVQPLCGVQTRVIAMKGHYPEQELAAVPAGWRVEAVRPVRIPGLSAERHLLRLVPDAPADRLAGP